MNIIPIPTDAVSIKRVISGLEVHQSIVFRRKKMTSNGRHGALVLIVKTEDGLTNDTDDIFVTFIINEDDRKERIDITTDNQLKTIADWINEERFESYTIKQNDFESEPKIKKSSHL